MDIEFTGYLDCKGVPIHVGDRVSVDEGFYFDYETVTKEGNKYKMGKHELDMFSHWFTRVLVSVKWGELQYE